MNKDKLTPWFSVENQPPKRYGPYDFKSGISGDIWRLEFEGGRGISDVGIVWAVRGDQWRGLSSAPKGKT